jgi:hypothetical protein
MSDAFITEWLEQGHALSSLLFSFASEYTISKVKENKNRMEMNRTHQKLTCWEKT